MNKNIENITGLRLRELRRSKGLSQKELSKRASISPSYMNLIETGKRRIGGTLLKDLARVLDVEVALLSGSSANAHRQGFAKKAKALGASDDEIWRLIAERPQWVEIFERQISEVSALKSQIKLLSDRLGDDALFSENIHELLSKIASIRSTASILNTQGGIGVEREAKFREILHTEAREASNAVRQLIAHFENSAQHMGAKLSVAREFSNYLQRHQFYIAELEGENGVVSQRALMHWIEKEFGEEAVGSVTLVNCLRTLLRDMRSLPRKAFLSAIRNGAPSVEALAVAFDTPVDRVVRRLALLSGELGLGRVSLVIMDQLGDVWLGSTMNTTIEAMRHGCVHWPIYQLDAQSVQFQQSMINLDGDVSLLAMAAKGFAAAEEGMPQYVLRTQMSFETVPDLPIFASALHVPAQFDCLQNPNNSCVSHHFRAITEEK